MDIKIREVPKEIEEQVRKQVRILVKRHLESKLPKPQADMMAFDLAQNEKS